MPLALPHINTDAKLSCLTSVHWNPFILSIWWVSVKLMKKATARGGGEREREWAQPDSKYRACHPSPILHYQFTDNPTAFLSSNSIPPPQWHPPAGALASELFMQRGRDKVPRVIHTQPPETNYRAWGRWYSLWLGFEGFSPPRC